MVTRKDVAEYAGVSVATVSYVVNHTKRVSPEVEKRVRDAVETLGYRPNLVARSLVTKETYHVAMLVDNLKNSYYTSILEGAQSVANDYGYIVSSLLIDYANRNSVLELTARGVDGYIILATEKQKLKRLLKNQCWVMTDECDIILDYQQGMMEAVKSLKEQGHEKIAFLSGLHIADVSHHSRLKLLRKAMKKYGLTINEKLFIDGNPKQTTDEEAGMEAARRLLDTGEAFTAVIAINDLMAIGAIREFYLQGIRVPEDVSVIGCDNISETMYSTPSISTIDVQSFEQGRALMKKLISIIKDQPFEPVTITGKYIERESVAQCKQKNSSL